MFDLTVCLALIGCGLVGLAIAAVCLKYYEVAIVLILLSPWVVSVFIPNSPQAEHYEGLGSFARMGVLVLLGGIGLVYFVKGLPLHDLWLPVPFRLLALFLLFALISAAYSIDTRYTLIRATAFVTVFGFLLGFSRWISQNDRITRTFNLLFLTVTGVLLANLVSFVIAPEKVWWWNGSHRFQGLAGHPNSMGAFLMVGYPMLFWKLSSVALKRKRLLLVSLIILAVLLHVLTGSRATFLAAIAGSAVWLVARRKTSLLILASSVIGILVFAGFATFGLDTVKPESFQRGKHSSGITDLKGRPELWAGSLYMVNGRPFTGYGFGVEGRIWNDRRFLDPELTLWSGSAKSSLHNGYLGIAVGLGWTGLVLWLLMVLIPIWSLLHLKVDHCVAAILATTSMCLLVNLVEGAISGSRSVTSLTFWIMWAIAIQLTRRNSPSTALRSV